MITYFGPGTNDTRLATREEVEAFCGKYADEVYFLEAVGHDVPTVGWHHGQSRRVAFVEVERIAKEGDEAYWLTGPDREWFMVEAERLLPEPPTQEVRL